MHDEAMGMTWSVTAMWEMSYRWVVEFGLLLGA